jgi:copper chaperone CopZ
MKRAATMIEREITIQGMTCSHCVMAVRHELARLPHVVVKEVKIGSAVLSYDETAVTPEQIGAAVEKAGYRALV